jgi:general secretion pathway protein C
MLARITAFIVWALVAATVVFWGLRLLVRPQPAPSYALAVGDAAVMRGDLARLLGAAPVAASPDAPAAPELASRFKLIGVMAPKPTAVAPAGARGPGYALIAVDGKPARAFAVGATLDSGLVLQSVSLRSASIGPAQGTTAVKLELPPLPAPATGTLPPPVDGAAVPVAPRPATAPSPPPQVRPPLPSAPPGQQMPPPGGAPAARPQQGALTR